MIRELSITKRGPLTATVYEDTERGTYRFYAEIVSDSSRFDGGITKKSPYSFDEDLATNWVDEQFTEYFKK